MEEQTQEGETMSKRISFWLAWIAWVLFLVITFFTELLTLKNASFELLGDIFYDLVLLIFITIGAFIASHRPENPIGWIICAATLIWSLSDLALEYGVFWLVTPARAPPLWVFVFIFGGVGRGRCLVPLMSFFLVLFPHRDLSSSFWATLSSVHS